MSKLFEEVVLLSDKINYGILLEPEEGNWANIGNDVYWEVEDEVYSGELFEGYVLQDGCVFINVRNGSGLTITKVFLTAEELSEEEFLDKYKDQL